MDVSLAASRVVPRRIAVLEDDPAFAQELVDWLRGEGFEVVLFGDGPACLAGLRAQRVDLALFDWNLPGLSGPEVMTRLRQDGGRAPPVIFLTAQDGPEQMVQVLSAGADDHVVKPPVLPVLRARIEAVLRRAGPARPVRESLGELVIDHETRTITRDGAPVALTGKQLLLALHLLARRGELVTRRDLNDLIGAGEVAVDTRRLDVHLSHLRSKLGWTADRGWRLASVYQQGYRLEYLN